MPGGRPRCVVGVDDGLHADATPRRHGCRGQSHRQSHRLPRRKDVAALQRAVGLGAKDKLLVVRVSPSLFQRITSPVCKSGDANRTKCWGGEWRKKARGTKNYLSNLTDDREAKKRAEFSHRYRVMPYRVHAQWD